MRRHLAVAAALALSGCTATPPPAEIGDHATGSVTSCTEPRPEVCTMVYDPVCATLAGGERASFASGCSACARDTVRSYVSGPCPE